jgi:hypothetical protein
VQKLLQVNRKVLVSIFKKFAGSDKGNAKSGDTLAEDTMTLDEWMVFVGINDLISPAFTVKAPAPAPPPSVIRAKPWWRISRAC